MAGPKLRAFRERAILHALSLLRRMASRIPLPLAQRVGRRLGAVAYLFAARDRRRAMANLAVAFPDWSTRQRRAVTGQMFRHLGTSLFEILWLTRRDEQARAAATRLEGLEPVLELIRAGHSVVAFTAHCGNWEWLAYSVARLGVSVTVLQRERTEAGVSELITSIRRDAGVETIDRGSTLTGRALIRAMRRPGFVAFLIDQSIRAESAQVPFFGRPALTPIGPATLAIRTGAYAVAIFIERRDGVQHIRIAALSPTGRGDDPIALTAKMTLEIERQIRAVPAQWVWFHDRWRDRPRWDIARQP